MLHSGFLSWTYVLVQLFLIIALPWNSVEGVEENVPGPINLDTNGLIEKIGHEDFVEPKADSPRLPSIRAHDEPIADLINIAANIESMDFANEAAELKDNGRMESRPYRGVDDQEGENEEENYHDVAEENDEDDEDDDEDDEDEEEYIDRWTVYKETDSDSTSKNTNSDEYNGESKISNENNSFDALDLDKHFGYSPVTDDDQTDWIDGENGNLTSLWSVFGCKEVFAEGNHHKRPIHNQSTWTMLRGAYQGVVGPILSTIHFDNKLFESGFLVPFMVDYVTGKGRGIRATTDLPIGTKVWESIHTARFPSPVEYRRFLASIPRDLACDVMVWAYVEPLRYEDYIELTISVDLDEGSLFNTEKAPGEQNVNGNYITTRDVAAGEELICSYADFEPEGAWYYLGM